MSLDNDTSFRLLLTWRKLTYASGRAYLISEPNNLSQLCGVEFRTRTAFCEAAIYSSVDRQSRFCPPLHTTRPQDTARALA